MEGSADLGPQGLAVPVEEERDAPPPSEGASGGADGPVEPAAVSLAALRDSEFAASSRSQPPHPQGESTFLPQLLVRYNFALRGHILRTADRKVGGGIQHCLHIIFCTISNWPPPHAHNRRRFWGTPGFFLNFS
jgi:hypothetical protein